MLLPQPHTHLRRELGGVGLDVEASLAAAPLPSRCSFLDQLGPVINNLLNPGRAKSENATLNREKANTSRHDEDAVEAGVRAANASHLLHKAEEAASNGHARDVVKLLGNMSAFLAKSDNATQALVAKAKAAGCDVGNLKDFDAAALKKLVGECKALKAEALKVVAGTAKEEKGDKEAVEKPAEKPSETLAGKLPEKGTQAEKASAEKGSVEKLASGTLGELEEKFNDAGPVEQPRGVPWYLLSAGAVPLLLVAAVGLLGSTQQRTHMALPTEPQDDDHLVVGLVPLE